MVGLVGRWRWSRVLPLAATLAAGAALPNGGAAQPGPVGAPEAVAARALPRGAVLEPRDIVYRGESPGSGQESEGVAPGWVTRRVIAEGEPLRRPAVAPPLVVQVGDDVQLVWRAGDLELRLRGRAMNAAAEGERVSVRVDTRRRFEGVAIAAGLVRLEHTSRSR